MKNELYMNYDSERKAPIFIANKSNDKSKTNNPIQVIEDMATLCEALCTLIHYAESNKIKIGADSLRDCIKHLQDGYIDASYSVFKLNMEDLEK